MKASAQYYEQQLLGLGNRFLDAVDRIASQEIIILAVMHLRRKPDYWFTREHQ